MEIGEWVRANRVDKGWTQADLARRLGSDNACVSRWERNDGLPRLGQFRQLCVLFESSADDALGLPSRKGPRRATRDRASA